MNKFNQCPRCDTKRLLKLNKCGKCKFIAFDNCAPTNSYKEKVSYHPFADGKQYEFRTDKYIVCVREKDTNIISKAQKEEIINYSFSSVGYNGSMRFPYTSTRCVPIINVSIPLQLSPKATDEEIEKYLMLL